MNCFLCGKKIGFLRSLSDKQYCSTAHRQEARMASAQVFREEEDVEGWAVARSRKKSGGAAKSSATSNAGAVLAFLAVGVVMIGVLMLGGAQKGGRAYPSVSFETGKNPTFVDRASGMFGGWVRSIAPVTLQDSFDNGLFSGSKSTLAEWANVKLGSGGIAIDDPRDWIGKNRSIPSLRIWKKSTAMQNYQMEFEGTLERTSLSYAIRAMDAGNFYATKIAIVKPGPLPNAGLIRYSMINGREVGRTMTPLPITLERGQKHHIRVTVQDDQFLTYLDGTWIGKFTDDKLVRGGVGFFDDANDPQNIAWVSVSERDSLLGRLLSHFALFVVPGDPEQR